MATREEAASVKLVAMQETMKLLQQMPVSVGEMPMDGGWGLKINLNQQPDLAVNLPDNIMGVPARFFVVGPAYALGKAKPKGESRRKGKPEVAG